MKCAARNREGGLLLIECVVYLVIFVILAALALACFYVAWEHHRDLSRNADAIAKTTHVGELWRGDVRRTQETIQVDEAGLSMELARPTGKIVYRLSEDKVVRSEGTNAAVVLLEPVSASRLFRIDGRHARAWRWELQLALPQKAARLTPLFVFTSVPKSP